MIDNNNNNRNNSNLNQNNDKRKVFWSITIVFLVLLIVIGGVLIFVLLNKPKTTSNENTNISQDTLLFKQTDIVPFKDKVEDSKWTQDEFKANYQSLGLTTFARDNLKVDGNQIRNLIDEVYPLSNSKIQINLNEFANIKYLMSTDISRDLSYLVNNLLYIDGLNIDFIQGIRLTKLNSLYSAINAYINGENRKYTISEFQKDVNDNKEYFKSLVSDNLYISDVQKINPNDILNVEFDKSNNFTVELNNQDVKYYIDVVDEDPNISLNNSVLTIWNLNYYTTEIINENNLNNLKTNVQKFIDKTTNRFSSSQFIDQINSNVFKTEIASYLNISPNSIGNVEYQNNVLKIQPANRIKFRLNTNNSNNLLDSDGNIRVSNLTFYDSISLYNLDKLYNAINDYINDSNNKFTPAEFKSDFNKNFTHIRNLVLTNLYTSSSSTLAQDKIQDISLDGLNHLVITLKTDYVKYSIATPYQNVYFDNDTNTIDSKLVIDNLQYYNEISISDANLNSLESNIQNYINLNKLTKQEFISNISKLAFKSEIMKYLNISNVNVIGNIAFENDILEIIPSTRNKFSSASKSSLIVNDNIQVSNLKFFTQTNITNLYKLWDSIDNYITNSTRKLTSDEFRANLTSDSDSIKTIIANNIDVILNNTKSIDKTKITSLLLNNNNELEITLDSNFVKYQLSLSNADVNLVDNKLIVKNLKFFNAINIATDNLNNLKTNIQNYIDNSSRQYTEEQFSSQINSDNFRNEIIKYLGVNNASVVDTISYSNSKLTITPTINATSRNKFTSANNSNLIVNNNIEISNFRFFNVTTLSNADKLTNVINTIITSNDNMFTSDEFKNYITSNSSALKETIASNIDISWNEKLNSNKIQSLELNNLNQLVISLDPTYAKYELFAKNSNIELINNQMFINNLTFYTEINVSNENLSNIRTILQKYVTDNSIMDGSFNANSAELINLVSSIKTEDNKNLASFIKEATIESRNVKFILKDFIKMTPKTINETINGSVVTNEVTKNSIQINNLTLSPSENYFTWNGNKITGLTDSGKQQTNIVVPEKTTEISPNVFAKNTKIESVDMSLSKITKFSDVIINGGLFYKCTNLKTVKLPNTLTYIGMNAFNGCSSLSEINPQNNENSKLSTETKNKLPSTLKTISEWAFNGCSSLSEISIPDSVEAIRGYAFSLSGLKKITIPSSVSELGSYSFQDCASLTEVKLPNELKRIERYTFAGCDRLLKINIPDKIEFIDSFAFAYCHHLIIYVSSQEIKDKFKTFNIGQSNLSVDDWVVIADSSNDGESTGSDSSDNNPDNNIPSNSNSSLDNNTSLNN